MDILNYKLLTILNSCTVIFNSFLTNTAGMNSIYFFGDLERVSVCALLHITHLLATKCMNSTIYELKLVFFLLIPGHIVIIQKTSWG